MPNQLTNNYSAASGFVQLYPNLYWGNLNYPIYCGVLPSISPSLPQFMSLPSFDYNATDIQLSGINVTIPSGNNEYIYVLFPALIGTLTTFIFNGFPVNFVTTDSPQFMIIDGVNQAYIVYRSQYQQNGTNIVLTVPSTSVTLNPSALNTAPQVPIPG